MLTIVFKTLLTKKIVLNLRNSHSIVLKICLKYLRYINVKSRRAVAYWRIFSKIKKILNKNLI